MPMRSKVQKWGNSLALRIPKPYAEEAGLTPDSAVELSLQEGKLVVMRADTPVFTLLELLEGVTPSNLHREIDMGRTVGSEAW
jgi:antitoxin MazE